MHTWKKEGRGRVGQEATARDRGDVDNASSAAPAIQALDG